MRRRPTLARLAPLVVAPVLALGLAACADAVEPRPPAAAEGDPRLGQVAIGEYGCGSCHRVPGVAGADGLVGPPLDSWSQRSFIAGALPNTQENLVRWITDPQEVEPGTAMPDVGVDEADAEDIAAYLLTLE